MSNFDRALSPRRIVVAISDDGLAVLDCGHVRGRSALDAKRVAETVALAAGGSLGCDACQADCNDSLALAGLERGQGLHSEPQPGGGSQ